jgi:hypothetical protein
VAEHFGFSEPPTHSVRVATSVVGRPKSVASLELLYHVALYVRAMTARPETVKEAHIREIYAIMDAIHNIPSSIVSWTAFTTATRSFAGLEFENSHAR